MPQNRTLKALAIATLAAFTMTGCASLHNSMQRSHIGQVQLAPLDRTQYEIVGDVQGQGEASYFLFFRLGGQQATSSLYETSVLGTWGGIAIEAAGLAQFNAIQSIQGADALIAPRYEVETTGIPLLFYTQKVKVYAKAIRLKATDKPAKRVK